MRTVAQPVESGDDASSLWQADPIHLGAGAQIVCVAGMHRSGTSMVTRLLNLCGVDLGPEDELLPVRPDNPEGHWESRTFMDLNDAVLTVLGGSWHTPPVAEAGWVDAPDIAPLRAQAAALVRRFADRVPWGWKDPRNCLTLPLWRAVLPDLRVVVCLRNPLEVVASLKRRADVAMEEQISLWLAYHRALLTAVPTTHRIVTHYDAYFDDPRAEVTRVVRWLGLFPSEDKLAAAVASAKRDQRHHAITTVAMLREVADEEVVRCYLDLCAEAGPVCQVALEGQPMGDVPESLPEASERALDRLARRRVVRVEAELTLAAEELTARRAELSARRDELAARNVEVAALRGQIADLDARLQTAVARTKATEVAVAAQTARTRSLAAQLSAITSSRGWRLLELLWRVRLYVAPPGSRRARMFRAISPRRRAPAA